MSNPLIESRSRFVQANPEARVRVNEREWGVTRLGESGPALILIPGTLGHGDLFWQQIERLSMRARVTALTYPVLGSIGAWADDVCALMDQFSLASASMLGSSLGGYLVQFIAGTYPERVDTLFAANTLAAPASVAERPQYADIDGTPIEALRAGIAGGLNAWARAHPEYADLVALLLQELDPRISETALRTRLRALKDGPKLPPAGLPRERIFTIESDDDPIISRAMRDAVRARLSPVKDFHFDVGGHFPYVVRPDDYSAMIEEALGL
ncbi:MAG: alpha/beta hydrolase [Burkholderiaceae bacterium]|nr:alpha/beta hydrolase [Burkholderiaceae bacterium]